eukprot:TRINITY_DN3965_c0_g1_i1.p1 TRINITY_DN3965_c0_g1~~TRINITY_DN3965_c0_g1_i1.p1  ORF type:complete len:469 (-),score=27.33 TRINITY_DN3965_c0_g1_i1:58-1464(-)
MGVSDTSGTKYSLFVGFVFVFNLIVGAGALALPLAFHKAGLILGIILLSVLCFLGYITITFMIEAQSIANALKYNESPEIDTEPLWNESSSINKKEDEGNTFYIRSKIEVSEMAETFLGPIGNKLFFAVMIIYLYGDLAIYAVAVPNSLVEVTGAWVIGNNMVDEYKVYWIYLSFFTVLLVPFTFFDFQKTRYLQIATLITRNVSLLGMIIIASIYDSDGGSMPTQWFNWAGLPNLFGVALYAFMCHHSLPSIVTPISNQKRLNLMMGLDNVTILITYIVLCFTAVWAYGSVTNPTCLPTPGPPCELQSLYTINFASYSVHPIAIFLVLYPVFTLSTNFPLIAITLRNNLMQLITYKKDEVTPGFRQTIFALIAVVPPIIIATVYRDVETLVSYTGAYGGLGIMFLFPALLVQFARKKAAKVFSEEELATNYLASPFKHRYWIYLIYGWCVLALGGQIFRQVWSALGH